MPYKIRIRQTGIFRTKIEINDLCMGKYKAGMQDRFQRFLPMIPSEGYLIIYDPLRIGTGLKLLYDPDETDEIILNLPVLTTISDIEMVMNITREVMKKWHSWNVKFEDVRYTEAELDQLKDLIRTRSLQALEEAISSYDEGVTLVHGAMWPLMFETEKLRKIGREHDEEGFANLLHECQSRDLTWCACHVYLSEDQKNYQGVYTIECANRTIIPVKPMPPVDMIDPSSGDEISCQRYIARVVVNPMKRPLMQMDYHKFLELIHASALPRYDACHVICELDEEEILRQLQRKEEMEGKPCW